MPPKGGPGSPSRSGGPKSKGPGRTEGSSRGARPSGSESSSRMGRMDMGPGGMEFGSGERRQIARPQPPRRDNTNPGGMGENFRRQTPPPPARRDTMGMREGIGRQTPPPPPRKERGPEGHMGPGGMPDQRMPQPHRTHHSGTGILGSLVGAALGALASEKINSASESAEEASAAEQAETEESTVDYRNTENYPSTCPGCGAPTTGKEACEYCGTKLI